MKIVYYVPFLALLCGQDKIIQPMASGVCALQQWQHYTLNNPGKSALTKSLIASGIFAGALYTSFNAFLKINSFAFLKPMQAVVQEYKMPIALGSLTAIGLAAYCCYTKNKDVIWSAPKDSNVFLAVQGKKLIIVTEQRLKRSVYVYKLTTIDCAHSQKIVDTQALPYNTYINIRAIKIAGDLLVLDTLNCKYLYEENFKKSIKDLVDWSMQLSCYTFESLKYENQPQRMLCTKKTDNKKIIIYNNQDAMLFDADHDIIEILDMGIEDTPRLLLRHKDHIALWERPVATTADQSIVGRNSYTWKKSKELSLDKTACDIIVSSDKQCIVVCTPDGISMRNMITNVVNTIDDLVIPATIQFSAEVIDKKLFAITTTGLLLCYHFSTDELLQVPLKICNNSIKQAILIDNTYFIFDGQAIKQLDLKQCF